MGHSKFAFVSREDAGSGERNSDDDHGHVRLCPYNCKWVQQAVYKNIQYFWKSFEHDKIPRWIPWATDRYDQLLGVPSTFTRIGFWGSRFYYRNLQIIYWQAMRVETRGRAKNGFMKNYNFLLKFLKSYTV